MFPVLKLEHEQWTEDIMNYRVMAFGQAVTGKVLVGDKEVRVGVTVPWPLQKFADSVRETITLRARMSRQIAVHSSIALVLALRLPEIDRVLTK